MGTEKITNIFWNTWVTISVRQLLLKIVVLSIVYCYAFLVYFLGVEMNIAPQENVAYVMLCRMIAFICWAVLLYVSKKWIQQSMEYNGRKNIDGNVWWLIIGSIIFSQIMYYSLWSILFYSQWGIKDVVLIFCLLVCFFLLTAGGSYNIIREQNVEVLLNEMLKKECIKNIFEQALRTDKPIILTGKDVSRDHQILIDMNIFHMINKSQMRNIRVDDRIAISIPQHMLEKYIQRKELNKNERGE